MARTGKVYYSNQDGTVPENLLPGDIVVSDDGAYVIAEIKDDNSYQLNLVNPNTNKSNFNPTNEGLARTVAPGQETVYPKSPQDIEAEGLAQELANKQGPKYEEGDTADRTTSTPNMPITPPPTTNSSPGSDQYDAEIREMINQLSEAQKANRVAGLTSAMNSSLSNLDTEQAAIGDDYYNQRNQAAANSDVGAYNFAQYMASRGIKGNAGAMPEIYRNAGLQNQIGALGQQEAQANTGIENQRTSLQNNFNTDVEAANSAADAQKLENYINQMNADRTHDTQAQQYLDSQFTAEKAEFAANIGAYSKDYMAQINRVQDDGDPSNDWQIPYLQDARNKKLAAQEEARLLAEQQERDNLLAQQKIQNTGSTGTKPTTLADLQKQMSSIYEMNLVLDPVTRVSTLTDQGRASLYEYASTYGGAYADQLLTMYGVGDLAPTRRLSTEEFNSLKNELMGFRSAEGRRYRIEQEMQNGLSEEDAQALLDYFFS